MFEEVAHIDQANPDYPTALQEGAAAGCYPKLWAIGNLAILKKPLLGFFCSIRCPGDAILRTYDAARALRDAGVAVIGGFHSPMEKECLDLLLRGAQPVVVCPARSIEKMRIPSEWRKPIEEGRLLVISPFEAKHRRLTAKLAEQRNQFVGALAHSLFIPYAAPGGKTEYLCQTHRNQGKRILTLDEVGSLGNFDAKLLAHGREGA